MTTLTDQLGLLEAERDRIKAENETLKIRIAKQAGALDESRAQVRQLILRNEKLKEHITTLKEHFHAFHGAAERIARQHTELDEADRKANPNPTPEPTVAEVINSPEAVETIKRRIKRIMGTEEKVAVNGQA